VSGRADPEPPRRRVRPEMAEERRRKPLCILAVGFPPVFVLFGLVLCWSRAPGLLGQIWCAPAAHPLPVELHRSEPEAGKVILSGISVNKVRFGRFGGGGRGSGALAFARRGGEGSGTLDASGCWWSILPQGSSAASLWRFITPASFSLSSLMVERRPLQPTASVTVISGRRTKVFINLQAVMPLQRPFGFGAVSSRLLVPSGFVPGDVEVDCVEPNHGGVGAGLDRFFVVSSKVLCAKCKGLCVFLLFCMALHVICTSTAEYS
jgi:hypothetical protein